MDKTEYLQSIQNDVEGKKNKIAEQLLINIINDKITDIKQIESIKYECIALDKATEILQTLMSL